MFFVIFIYLVQSIENKCNITAFQERKLTEGSPLVKSYE